MVRLRPVTLREANAFVRTYHRHHGPVVGWKFGVGVEDEAGRLVGVAIAGRPVARMLDDGRTLEVLRCCTDGTPHVASMLYAAIGCTGVPAGDHLHPGERAWHEPASCRLAQGRREPGRLLVEAEQASAGRSSDVRKGPLGGGDRRVAMRYEPIPTRDRPDDPAVPNPAPRWERDGVPVHCVYCEPCPGPGWSSGVCDKHMRVLIQAHTGAYPKTRRSG